jgi:hypothetical protein
VPAGGTAGQVLEKVNGTDYNTQWTTPAEGGARYIVLPFAAASYNPADAGTKFIGSLSAQSPRDFATQPAIRVPVAGTVVGWWVKSFVNSVGSNENVNFYLRLNDTTDFGNITDQWDTGYTDVASGALTQAVSAGDSLVVKVVAPTWPTTNPTSVNVQGWILIQV